MALVYLGLFLLSALIVSGVIYKVTRTFLDRQAEERILAEADGLVRHHERGGLPKVIAVLEDRLLTVRPVDILLLSDPKGIPLVGNLPVFPAVAPDTEGWITFQPRGTDGEQSGGEAQALGIVRALPDGHRLLVGVDLGRRWQFRSEITSALLWTFLVVLGISLAGSVIITRHFTRRLEVINRTTRRIMNGDLHSRIPRSPHEDELDRLASNLNGMLDQIEDLMAGLRHLSEDIAHDLRTPLNRLRGQLELAVIEAQDGDPVRDMVQEAIAEADRLLDMFGALLSIAQARAGHQQMPLADLSLAPIVRRVVELYEPVAEERNIGIHVDIQNPAPVRGHEQLLAQALANLVDNAVKYTPEGGRIDVMVVPGKERNATELIVADNGIGIPPEEYERVLGRFIRLDWSRSTPGNGLGLSLVDAVSRLHGAKLIMEDNRPGLRVRLCFPQHVPVSRQAIERLP